MAAKRKLKNWIKSYMEYSAYSEAPTLFHFWTAVSTLAGALQRKVWIDMRYFQWTPNFFIVFVAPPGIVNKSTTMSIGMNLLREIEGINFGPDTVTWQALIQSLAQSRTEFEMPGHDSTDILDRETSAMSAITIASSEFGTFMNPNDREMVDMLVSLWDGQIGAWEKTTKTQGSDRIINPWINLIAATTPAWIAGNFPEYLIGGGFTSRTIFVYGEKKRHLVAYPGDIIPEGFDQQRADLIHDLELINTQMIGEYQLTPEAKEWGKEWYDKLHLSMYENKGGDEGSDAYLARKQTHMHKLAMILAASERDDLNITKENLMYAEEIFSQIEKDMKKVFSKINAPEVRAQSKLLEIIQAHGKPIPITDLYIRVHQTMSYTDFSAAWQGAVKGGILVRDPKNKTLSTAA